MSGKPATTQSLKGKIKLLEEITTYFAQEEVDLDEGIKKYEAGMQLAKEIRDQLTSYELKINEIKSKYDEDLESSDLTDTEEE